VGAGQEEQIEEHGLRDDEPSDSDPDPVPTQAVDVVDTFEGEAALQENIELLEDGPALLEFQSGCRL